MLFAEAAASVLLFALIVSRLLPFTSPDSAAWPFVLDRNAIFRDFVMNAVVPNLFLVLAALRVRRSSEWWRAGAWSTVAGVVAVLLSAWNLLAGLVLPVICATSACVKPSM